MLVGLTLAEVNHRYNDIDCRDTSTISTRSFRTIITTVTITKQQRWTAAAKAPQTQQQKQGNGIEENAKS